MFTLGKARSAQAYVFIPYDFQKGNITESFDNHKSEEFKHYRRKKSKLKTSDETWFEGSFWMPPLTHTAGLSRGRRVESAALVTIHRDSRSFSPVWGSLEVFEGQCPVDLL